MSHRTRIAFLLVLVGLNVVADLRAGAQAASKNYNLDSNGLALQGYDPVSYFDAGRAAKGKPEFTAGVNGATYRFATHANRQKFLADPAKYEPAYGGWCATAMAEGKKVEIDPGNFKVTDGRLFLFYKSLLADARKAWNKDEAGLRAKADANWKRISAE
jgi:YHS domain-containing protein